MYTRRQAIKTTALGLAGVAVGSQAALVAQAATDPHRLSPDFLSGASAWARGMVGSPEGPAMTMVEWYGDRLLDEMDAVLRRGHDEPEYNIVHQTESCFALAGIDVAGKSWSAVALPNADNEVFALSFMAHWRDDSDASEFDRVLGQFVASRVNAQQ